MSCGVIAVAEGIPFIELTGWDHQRLYDLKGQVVAAGVKAVTGLTLPIFNKSAFSAWGRGSTCGVVSFRCRLVPSNLPEGLIQPLFQDDWILARRPARNVVSADRPYAFLVEPEAAPRRRGGGCHDFSDESRVSVPLPDVRSVEEHAGGFRRPRQIPAQIRHALERLPSAQHLKLYNAGNFFDPQAIPPEDYAEIARLAAPFERVIVECHPR